MIADVLGQVIVGVATDTCLVPDPESIIDAFHAELEFLRNWGRPPRPSYPEAAINENEDGKEVSHQRCQALTKSGSQCKNMARPGSVTCRMHTVE